MGWGCGAGELELRPAKAQSSSGGAAVVLGIALGLGLGMVAGSLVVRPSLLSLRYRRSTNVPRGLVSTSVVVGSKGWRGRSSGLVCGRPGV